ncbi:hypothetical protein OIU84_015984 [Salix udensis]|uniref:FAS1 domain-containing protein n=1 Tax=Salix udensis TaxID=889485 RepID=A0AAD6J8J0_9ROSI|nr:hypothetical protein OIU84_015984 [Salix udensis]
MAALQYSLLLSFTLSALVSTVLAHNITDILSGFPEYSEFNKYLTQTKLADEINTRQTITVLALNNGAMSALAAKHPLSVIKNALSLLTTGNAPGNLGFVNITDLQGGKVGFGSAAPGSKLESSYTKSVKQVPYNISILEISQPIIAPGILTAPAPTPSSVNMTALLEKAGCKTFASLLQTSGVIKMYQSAADKVVSLLQYHATASYSPFGSLKTSKDPISTLASNGAGKFDLTVTSAGDSVTLHTGIGPSRVAETVLDSTPLVIFTVDNVLLPVELFGKAPSPAPAGEPVSAPSPSPIASTPAPASVEAPSPLAASPPAPPMETPGGAPADAPFGSENSTADGNAAVHASVPVQVTVFAAVICSILVS